MTRMKERFPDDMDYVVSLDTTLSVTEGMKEIVETLLIALLLVILVVYLFLQSLRATLIPLLAVPVSLIGTFVLFPLSARSTRFLCSGWCSRLVWWSMTPLLWSRALNGTSKRA